MTTDKVRERSRRSAKTRAGGAPGLAPVVDLPVDPAVDHAIDPTVELDPGEDLTERQRKVLSFIEARSTDRATRPPSARSGAISASRRPMG